MIRRCHVPENWSSAKMIIRETNVWTAAQQFVHKTVQRGLFWSTWKSTGNICLQCKLCTVFTNQNTFPCAPCVCVPILHTSYFIYKCCSFNGIVLLFVLIWRTGEFTQSTNVRCAVFVLIWRMKKGNKYIIISSKHCSIRCVCTDLRWNALKNILNQQMFDVQRLYWFGAELLLLSCGHLPPECDPHSNHHHHHFYHCHY